MSAQTPESKWTRTATGEWLRVGEWDSRDAGLSIPNPPWMGSAEHGGTYAEKPCGCIEYTCRGDEHHRAHHQLTRPCPDHAALFEAGEDARLRAIREGGDRP
jgi:hypothetical protein